MARPSRSAALLALAMAACRPAEGGSGGVPVWPDSLPAAAATEAPRGLVPLRAVIHLHSVWSHDACDRKPVDESGRPDERCLARLRAAICANHADAVFLTDHEPRLGAAASIEEALLFRDGDAGVTAEGAVAAPGEPPPAPIVAKRQACPGGRFALWFAGSENALMPIAFDSLPPGPAGHRAAVLDRDGPGGADSLRALGAIVLLSHAEDLTAERAIALAPNGIELYNPHANFAPKHRRSQGMTRLGGYARLVPFYARLTRANPDLALIRIFRANHDALATWDRMLAERDVVGFGASDAHENALPWPLSDGDRGDSYHRLVGWVTNFVLLEPGAPATPRAIEEAVRAGRFYATIEAWGTPIGFDFHLEGPAGITEMGATVAAAPGQSIVVEPPRVSLRGLDPRAEPAIPEPRVRARLLRIDPGGRRTLVAESARTIRVPAHSPGAYRVEVGIVPRHLGPYLGGDPGQRELAWIYSNAIRVVAPTVGSAGDPAAAGTR